MKENSYQRILYFLIAIVILLLVANLGLFFRMNQLQTIVVQTLNGLRPQEPTYLSVGETAPNFSLTDTEGKDISFQKDLGHYTVLVFSSPTCPACKLVYPQLERFKSDFPEVNVLLLSYGSEDENKKLKQTERLTIPVLLGEEQVFKMYKVKLTPTFYLIDAEGVILEGGNSLKNIESLYQQFRQS